MHDFENGLFYGNCGIIKLTDKENRFLDLLIRNKGTVVTYTQFMNEIYKSKENKELLPRIAANMSLLRKKLKGEVQIKLKHRIGYMIDN